MKMVVGKEKECGTEKVTEVLNTFITSIRPVISKYMIESMIARIITTYEPVDYKIEVSDLSFGLMGIRTSYDRFKISSNKMMESTFDTESYMKEIRAGFVTLRNEIKVRTDILNEHRVDSHDELMERFPDLLLPKIFHFVYTLEGLLNNLEGTDRLEVLRDLEYILMEGPRLGIYMVIAANSPDSIADSFRAIKCDYNSCNWLYVREYKDFGRKAYRLEDHSVVFESPTSESTVLNIFILPTDVLDKVTRILEEV